MSAFDEILTLATQAVKNDRPFILYAKPGEQCVTSVFQRDSEFHRFDYQSSGFAFVSFDGQRRFFIPKDRAEIIRTDIPSSAAPPLTNAMPSFTPKEKKAFESLVAKGIDAIMSGKMGKVVLSRTEKVDCHADFATIYRRLLLTYPTAFRYCWFHPQTGIWMGATPERLLQVTERSFNTVALAGTQPFVDSEHVLWQDKEKTEQQFVTDFIVSGLREKTSQIQCSQPYTARAGNLLHIKTDISGTLNEESALEDVLSILHPTPAVCGYPKKEAKKFIDAHEGYDREYYSGYLGETGPMATDLYVNLRCMKIDNTVAHLYIGCGITKDSDPEKEFDETVNKALTMKKVLS